ncbi:LPXTG-motif protein cell wall anchor domain protein [Enterococcus faecalis 06-MB-DW-09]|nr:LPXTG-motif protein cell wall anchor domain protein [Enterococcus faecalis 06-MB-DW-09]
MVENRGRGMQKRIYQFLLILNIFIFGISSYHITGHSAEIRSAETRSSIGFTGIYEPIDKPVPEPPNDIITSPPVKGRPSGLLPRTNDQKQAMLNWWGAMLVVFTFFAWIKQKNRSGRRKEK